MPTPRKTLHLLYHELVAGQTPYAYATSADRFEEHLAIYRGLLDSGAPVEPRITFDDGHRSFFQHALPALEQYGLKAHLFVTAGWVGHRADTLQWEQLREIQQAGHTIGAHGWSHTLLTHCTPGELERELGNARHLLEDRLGSPVVTLSFPGGRFNRAVLEACRAAGYTQCFTSQPALADLPPGRLVGRVNVRQSMDAAAIRGLLLPGGSALRNLRLQERAKSLLKKACGDTLYARLWSRMNGAATPPDEAR